MKNICSQITTAVAIGIVTCASNLANLPKANAAGFALSWTGEQGYYAQGRFNYDDSFLGNIITENELTDFVISFFDPSGNLLQTFDYDFPTSDSEFNFNFNKVTKTILQTGNSEASDGFDLGINFIAGETGLDFYTFLDPSQGVNTATILLKNDLSPDVCDTFPNCGLDASGKLTATAIPEPGLMLGLLAVGAMSIFTKQKRVSNSDFEF